MFTTKKMKRMRKGDSLLFTGEQDHCVQTENHFQQKFNGDISQCHQVKGLKAWINNPSTAAHQLKRRLSEEEEWKNNANNTDAGPTQGTASRANSL